VRPGLLAADLDQTSRTKPDGAGFSPGHWGSARGGALQDSTSSREDGTVTFDEFIKQVQERGGFDTRQHAEQATRPTLGVLGQRLAGGEPSDLAAQLPADYGEPVRR
jgi:Uncharacterized conserved protein (DUF2267)